MWKPIKGFKAYEVSDLGSVRRIGAKASLKTHVLPSGNVIVTVFNLGKPYTRSVANLVLSAFGPKPSIPTAVARWRDGNRSNNSIDNLGWAVRPWGHSGSWRFLGETNGSTT